MTRLKSLLGLSAVSVCATLTSGAWGDEPKGGLDVTQRSQAPSSESMERASELFWQAHERYEAGDYADAIRLFRESYALVPQAETLFNIALSNARNGDCKEAERGYSAYTSLVESTRGAKAKPLPEDIGVQCAAELGAPVTVTREEFPDAIDVPVPTAAFSVTPTAPAPVAPVAMAGPTPVESLDDAPRSRSIVGWSLVGGAVVLAGATLYFVAHARDSRQRAADATEASGEDAGDRAARYQENSDRARTGAIVSGVLAAGLAGAGIALLLSGQGERTPASLTLDTNGGLRVSLAGAF